MKATIQATTLTATAIRARAIVTAAAAAVWTAAETSAAAAAAAASMATATATIKKIVCNRTENIGKEKGLGYYFSSLARLLEGCEATKKNCTVFINVHCKEDWKQGCERDSHKNSNEEEKYTERQREKE